MAVPQRFFLAFLISFTNPEFRLSISSLQSPARNYSEMKLQLVRFQFLNWMIGLKLKNILKILFLITELPLFKVEIGVFWETMESTLNEHQEIEKKTALSTRLRVLEFTMWTWQHELQEPEIDYLNDQMNVWPCCSRSFSCLTAGHFSVTDALADRQSLGHTKNA